MTGKTASSLYPSRMERIAAQLERMERRSSDWGSGVRGIKKSSFRRNEDSGGEGREKTEAEGPGQTLSFGRWEKWGIHDTLKLWGGSFKKLAEEMARKSKDPFTGRTRQISVLCAFAPFVCSVLGAAIRFMPELPYLSFWQKTTYFIAFPIFLAVAGAFVGFMIGVMLDTFEKQIQDRELLKIGGGESTPSGPRDVQSSQKMSVWVDVDELEENQRVAETVVGEDGTPILLRHTVLKPPHIQMLKDQNIDRIKIEALRFPAEGDLAFAG